jgi:predicted nucleic acid-binding protein
MPAGVVVDASVALSWILPDEATGRTLQLRSQAVADTRLRLFVPPIFWYETANVLWFAAKRERIAQALAIEALEALLSFQFDICPADPAESLLISFNQGIAVYDSAYLCAAIERKATLWTIDEALARAAHNLKIPVEP